MSESNHQQSTHCALCQVPFTQQPRSLAQNSEVCVACSTGHEMPVERKCAMCGKQIPDTRLLLCGLCAKDDRPVTPTVYPGGRWR